jgi:hypothetical protein
MKSSFILRESDENAILAELHLAGIVTLPLFGAVILFYSPMDVVHHIIGSIRFSDGNPGYTFHEGPVYCIKHVRSEIGINF